MKKVRVSKVATSQPIVIFVYNVVGFVLFSRKLAPLHKEELFWIFPSVFCCLCDNMVVSCDFQFDRNPNCTFSSGQLVKGIISLEFDKPKDVKAIMLKVLGFANAYWTKTSFDKTDSYWGQKNYVNSKIYLLGSKDARQCTLKAGRHQYAFSFHLPSECPTSFEGYNGRIRYTCKVILVRPWKFDQTFAKAITVIKELDLNLESVHLGKPLLAKAEKILWGLAKNEMFTLAVKLARSGFVSGEKMPIQLVVTNESNVTLKEILISLNMTAVYYENASRFNLVEEAKIISEIKCGGMQSYCKKLFDYELPIPATPPTSIGECPLIEITYNVRVEAIFKGLHSSQVICLPIMIGTVPIIRNPKRNLEEPRDTEACALPSPDHSRPSLNYEEAVHLPRTMVNADDNHDYGEREFAPLYPVVMEFNHMK